MSHRLSPVELELAAIVAASGSTFTLKFLLVDANSSPQLRKWARGKSKSKTFDQDNVVESMFTSATRLKSFWKAVEAQEAAKGLTPLPDEDNQNVEKDGSDDEDVDAEEEDAEEDEEVVEDSPDGEPEERNPSNSDPLELVETERELAQLLVSTPRLETGEYDWATIIKNASDELSQKIKIKSELKTFQKAPTETLVKYTRRKQWRQYMLGLQADRDEEESEDEQVPPVEELSPVSAQKNVAATTQGFTDADFSDLSEMDKVLANLMAETPRLPNGKYDWKTIHKRSPEPVQAVIDTKSTYAKFSTQPIDYVVSQSRRKLFRNYLIFLVGSEETCRNVLKPIGGTAMKSSPKGGNTPKANYGATPTSGRGSKLKIKLKKPLATSCDVEEHKPETKKRRRHSLTEGGDRISIAPSKKNRELGLLERELAELMERTPKLVEKGRASFDWEEIERRSSLELQKRFALKKHMSSFQKWPLHVMITDPFKGSFREYREKVRKSIDQGDVAREYHHEAEEEEMAVEEEEDDEEVAPVERMPLPTPVVDDSLGRTYSTRKVLEFRPRMTTVNKQYRVLNYTATEAKAFLQKVREIRQERLEGFLNNIDVSTVEQIRAFQNDDHDLVQRVLKEFLVMPLP
jgi:hypothetical protein